MTKNSVSFSQPCVTVHNLMGDEIGHVENDDGTHCFVTISGDVYTISEMRDIYAKMFELEASK